jgi:hypothetical protein
VAIDWWMMLAAKQKKILRPVDVAEVVGVVARSTRRLRSNVRYLGDSRHMPTVTENQWFRAVRVRTDSGLPEQGLDRRQAVAATHSSIKSPDLAVFSPYLLPDPFAWLGGLPVPGFCTVLCRDAAAAWSKFSSLTGLDQVLLLITGCKPILQVRMPKLVYGAGLA